MSNALIGLPRSLRTRYVLLLALLAGPSAQAGTVTLTPLGSTSIFSWGPPTSVDFRLGIGDDFDQDIEVTALSLTLDVGPWFPVSGISFAFADEFRSLFQLRDFSSNEQGRFLLDAFSFTGGQHPPLIDVGILTVDATTCPFCYEPYYIGAHGFVGDTTGMNHEVIGWAYFDVNVPEPSSLVLLAVGLLGVARATRFRDLRKWQAAEPHGLKR